MTGTRVVVTGAAGVVGRFVLDDLDARYEVRGVDARRTSGAARRVDRVQLRRPGAAARALAGADVVVHLADRASQSTPWQTVHHNNLRVLWNTLEAARSVGARRVVLASSNAVVGGYEEDSPYREILAGQLDGLDPSAIPLLTTDVPVRPNGAYAVGKVTAEAAGRFMADRHDLSVVALRIGTVRAADRPENVRHLSTLLTRRDLVHLVEQCIDAPDDVRFATFYGVSANTWRIWDISDARAVIGYEPVDDAERWREQ